MPKPADNSTAPQLLKDIQSWFSQIRRSPDSANQDAWRREADSYVTASASMSSQERLDVYVHDYWPRCLDSLADDFPRLVVHMARIRFDSWMTRYLEQYPSRSYTLYLLPDQLRNFMEAQYHESDRDTVLEIIDFEWAYAQARFVPVKPYFNPERMSDLEKQHLPSRKFESQPHVFFAKHPETHLPTMIYRSPSGVTEATLDPVQFDMFVALKQGLPLSAAIAHATTGMSDDSIKKIELEVTNWFSFAVAEKIWAK